jgi:hypothetical protein
MINFNPHGNMVKGMETNLNGQPLPDEGTAPTVFRPSLPCGFF